MGVVVSPMVAQGNRILSCSIAHIICYTARFACSIGCLIRFICTVALFIPTGVQSEATASILLSLGSISTMDK